MHCQECSIDRSLILASVTTEALHVVDNRQGWDAQRSGIEVYANRKEVELR